MIIPEYLGQLRCPDATCRGPVVAGEGFIRCSRCGWTARLSQLMKGLREKYV